MSASLTHQEKMYRAYMEFFDIAERKRRWHPLNDIPWEKLNPAKNSEEKAICVETFCGVELYVPDYTANGFNLTRTIFGHAWFQANWGYEESKHGLTFREYLIRSGQRTEEQYADFEQQIFAQVWKLPFHTRRQMTCYGALQESATFLIYRAQMEKARQEGDEVLDKIYFYVSRDEAAHMGFYIKVLQLELEEDREGTLADLAYVIYHFQMPGVGLIPEYDQRLGVNGVGISSQQFLQRGIFPLLRAVGSSRQEMVKLFHQKKKTEQPDRISA
ncbi:acyl-ACP desaturase [Aliterella atlantica]|uniref:Acyl-ACP desaturase n=1 Tax=Aliterella atlantica CENA595 TaxID=1618023 RepID=A0A0D8ZL58_9CYAN|nr:acyl-ACP desaturase [Aliterella atlantica]KJH69465.1 acyl-ACP desaturase [Aliterella atlantica CENA595]